MLANSPIRDILRAPTFAYKLPILAANSLGFSVMVSVTGASLAGPQGEVKQNCFLLCFSEHFKAIPTSEALHISHQILCLCWCSTTFS